jgi:hypothetical protein
MWKFTEKSLMNISEYIPLQILAQFILRFSIVFLWKIELFCCHPLFNPLFSWVLWSERPLIILHSLHCYSQQVPSNLFFWVPASNKTICWRFLADPSSTLGFQQNPKNHRPFWRLEGNTTHKVHNAVSPKMAYGWLHDLDVCNHGRDDAHGDVRHNYTSSLLQYSSFYHTIIHIYHSFNL